MPEVSTRGGCLTVLLRLIGIRLPTPSLPYRQRDDFLSAAERSFWSVLLAAVDGQAVLLTKVRVADLLYVPKCEGWQSHQNRIHAKHVDFVLCEQTTMRPLAAIELDDSSHARAERIDRDEFLDAAFEAAGLPLLRFRVQRSYDPRAIAQELSGCFARSEPRKKPATTVSPPGNCRGASVSGMSIADGLANRCKRFTVRSVVLRMSELPTLSRDAPGWLKLKRPSHRNGWAS